MGTTRAPAVRLANSIIRRALAEGVSDFHLEPRAEELVVRYRVDGVLKRGTGVPLRLKDSPISRFKIMGDLDISTPCSSSKVTRIIIHPRNILRRTVNIDRAPKAS